MPARTQIAADRELARDGQVALVDENACSGDSGENVERGHRAFVRHDARTVLVADTELLRT